jgi:hypothetical protein
VKAKAVTMQRVGTDARWGGTVTSKFRRISQVALLGGYERGLQPAAKVVAQLDASADE